MWERDTWDLPDDTHTVVETFDDGWAWSVPVSATVRHVGVMVGPPRIDAGWSMPIRGVVGSAGQVGVAGSEQRSSRDREDFRPASTSRRRHAAARLGVRCVLVYSEPYTGAQFFLVGDAGSFIDPLSSFGVKKALASAWVAAVAAHTSLLDSARQTVARDFFSNWERGVYATHLRRSRDFARAALAEHPSAFWADRADVEIPAPSDDGDGSPQVPSGSGRRRRSH